MSEEGIFAASKMTCISFVPRNSADSHHPGSDASGESFGISVNYQRQSTPRTVHCFGSDRCPGKSAVLAGCHLYLLYMNNCAL